MFRLWFYNIRRKKLDANQGEKIIMFSENGPFDRSQSRFMNISLSIIMVAVFAAMWMLVGK